MAVVTCAPDQGLKVQPHSGGHSFADFCIGSQDSVVIINLTYFLAPPPAHAQAQLLDLAPQQPACWLGAGAEGAAQ